MLEIPQGDISFFHHYFEVAAILSLFSEWGHWHLLFSIPKCFVNNKGGIQFPKEVFNFYCTLKNITCMVVLDKFILLVFMSMFSLCAKGRGIAALDATYGSLLVFIGFFKNKLTSQNVYYSKFPCRHTDSRVATKDGRTFSVMEDDMADVYPLLLRLSILRETNSLGVKITKKVSSFY